MATPLQSLIQGTALSLKASWSITEPEWCPLNLSVKQKLFLDLPHLEVLYGGSAGSGKTIALAAGALQHVNNPEYHGLLLRRTYADLSKPGSLMDVLHDWLSGTAARWNDQKKQWRFPSSAIIQFGYIETNQDRFRYKSDNYQFVGFDELTSFEEEPYVYLISRLRRPKGSTIPLRIRAGTNPGDIGAIWVMDRFVPEGFNGDMSRANLFVEKLGVDGAGQPIMRAFVPALLTDNKGIDQESYIKSLNQLDPITRAQLLSGDWQIRQRGDVYPEWDERYHIITWSEFERMVGSRRIPDNWLLGIGLDWGSTESHPYVASFVARAPENSPLAGKVFLYKAITGFAEPPRQVAERIYEVLNEDHSFDRVYVWLMSHEAKSERDTFVMDHGLPFGPWKADRTGGIAQVRDFLQIRGDKPDLFHEQMVGSPGLYGIVEDDELLFAKSDKGLQRHRLEFPLYHYNERGIPESRKLNDAMDSLRGLAGVFFPPIASMTADEMFQRRLDNFKLENSPGPMNEEQRVIHEMSMRYHQQALIQEHKDAQGATHWMDRWKANHSG